MEGQTSTSKQEKKKTQISFGGGNGIGGVVVLGGALAVAGLIAVFAVKNRRRDANKNSKKPSEGSKESKNNFSCKREEDEGSEGLRFLSQTSSLSTHSNSCFRSHGTSKMSITQIDSCETLVFTKSLILEENPMTEISKEKEDSLSSHQAIILSYDSQPESIASYDDCGVIEESSSPESPIYIQETMEKNDAEKDTIPTRTIEDKKADEASPIAYAEEMAVEGDSAMQSGGEEENDDEGEESSVGTVDTSIESNADTIWPAELIKESSQEHKQIDTIFQSSLEKLEEEDKTVKIDEHGYFDSSKNGDAFKNEDAEEPIMIREETKEPVMTNIQQARSSKLRIWLFCVLLFVLHMLLLSLTHRKAVLLSTIT